MGTAQCPAWLQLLRSHHQRSVLFGMMHMYCSIIEHPDDQSSHRHTTGQPVVHAHNSELMSHHHELVVCLAGPRLMNASVAACEGVVQLIPQLVASSMLILQQQQQQCH